MKEFYYVHNRSMGNPTHRHSTEEEAIKEAQRLSYMHNKNFYVLKSVAKVTRDGEVDKKVEGIGE